MHRILVGMQWGDEGKGKVASAFPTDWSVRMNGGPNAGHTVRGVKVHQVPPGVIFPDARLAISAGSVVDVMGLVEEISRIEAETGYQVAERLYVDPSAHVITWRHKEQDTAENEHLGSTKRGNGPVHADKYARRGSRIRDDVTAWHILSERGVHLTPVAYRLSHAIEEGERVSLVVAHGTMLDIDHGTYPYVTSSHCTAAGALVGAGLPPSLLRRSTSVIGVVKAYTTRVAAGPMRGEYNGDLPFLSPEAGDAIREAGGEFGTTTGRARRIGVLDLGQLNYAARLNGPDRIFLTKMDTLSGMTSIPVLTSRWQRESALDYTLVPGWMPGDLSPDKPLPDGVRQIVGMVEQATGARVGWIGTGPGSGDVIVTGLAD